MAKQPRVWSGTAWEPLAVTLPDLSNYSTTTQMNTAIDSAKGLVQVIPTSVTKGASGSASVSSGGAVTFSGTESISLNGCFTSTYDNYLFVYSFTSAGADMNTYLRFRTGTTDNTNSSYSYTNLYYGSFYSASPTNSIVLGEIDTPNYINANGQLLVTNPYLANKTVVSGVSSGSKQGTAAVTPMSLAAFFDATTSFDGFTIYASTSTFGGTIRVYGYRNG